MKKTTILCVGLCAAMAFTSCKSNESAYKRAYEKAKQYDTAAAQQAPQTPQTAAPQTTEEVAVVAPVEAKPADEARVVDNLDNVSVRQESVTLINGSGLKDFSVIVGSFGLISNAEGLQQRLKAAGYDAQVVKNEEKNMYRVVASTFAGKADAVNSRDQLRATYPDARILSIDYGKKRTGLAVTDPLQIIAGGLATVSTSELFDWLRAYMAKEPVERIVIGEPRQPNGEPSENLQRVQQFVNRWRKAVPEVPIEYYDERFTSVLAHQAMLSGGLKKKARQDKALVDEISATIILEDYLRSKK